MNRKISFEIPQEPEQKKSPLLTQRKGRAMAIPDSRNKVNMAKIQWLCRQACPELHETHYGPVRLTVEAFFSIPASWSKKRVAEMHDLDDSMIQMPDADRIANLVMDALGKGFVWKDDSQVYDLLCIKLHTTGQPHTRVEIELIDAEYHRLPVAKHGRAK